MNCIQQCLHYLNLNSLPFWWRNDQLYITLEYDITNLNDLGVRPCNIKVMVEQFRQNMVEICSILYRKMIERQFRLYVSLFSFFIYVKLAEMDMPFVQTALSAFLSQAISIRTP